MRNNLRTLVQMLKQLNYILDKSQKRRAFWLLVVIFVSAGFELLGVTAILPFVEATIAPDKVLQNQYVKKIAPVLGITNANELLMFMGIGLILVYIVKNVFLFYANYIQYDFATRIEKELSVKMLYSYMSRPYTFFLNTNTSEILRGCNTDTSCVYAIIDFLCNIISQVLTVAMIGVFLIYTDPVIAISILFLMLIVLFAMIILFKPTIKKAGIKNQKLLTLKSKILVQATSGIKEIFVMQRKELFLDAYDEASDRSRKVQRTYNILSASPDRIVEGVCISGIIGIVCIRLVNDSAGMIDFIPKLAAFAMAAFKILPSIGKIANRMTGIIYNRPGLINVYRNMIEANCYAEQMQQYIVDKGIDVEQPEKLEFQEQLSINHVFWQYENQKEPVLTDVRLTVQKGESIAFIGASGAGKTTLSDIVLGLLQPSKGTVEMDGIDVYTIPMQWAHIVGYVPQSIFLMDDTVRNNIAFGLPAETVEDKYIWDALEKAQLKDFVEKLPYGLDTIVGERGVKFSGGQRQRVAIARALYNKPEILVLDEATAALDNETETAVMESIDALQGQITMIIVAHRLTTIRNCDRIYEIKDGVALERSKEEVFG
ncbi:MAG: ABC transporter ATP-binding protein [Lachnospiraceae bacterium]|nr:ABC transporter ATP-binding protein [Lachnospiraceae bacterium]